jgi:hypothetical protein
VWTLSLSLFIHVYCYGNTKPGVKLIHEINDDARPSMWMALDITCDFIEQYISWITKDALLGLSLLRRKYF